MFKDDYRREVDKLTANEKFKQDTISLMQEKQQQLEKENKTAKIIKFNPRPYRKLAASVAVALLAVSTMAYTFGLPDFLIGADSTTETERIDSAMEQDAEGGDAFTNYTADASPALSHKENHRVYSIDDAKAINTAEQNTEKSKGKIFFDTTLTGGFGFEGYCFYSPDELEQNSLYTVGDEFDTLPVYEYKEQSYQEQVKLMKDYISKFGVNTSQIKYKWTRPVYNEDGIFMSHEDAITFTSNIPSEEYMLNSADSELSITYPKYQVLGDTSLWAYRNELRVSFDSALSQTDTPQAVYQRAKEKYPKLISENMDYTGWSHYNFYGEVSYDVYAYEKSDDYGQTLFNSSVNSINISQHERLETDTEPTTSIFWIQFPCYELAEYLPAIDYQQALDLLFNGQFFSSFSDQISDDTVISHIELTYLEPPYSLQTLKTEGYSVPFYKFFVQLPEEYDKVTEAGILKNYTVYYVCAIHPDYIQLADNYYHFN